ncbi:MAG TPA: M56 family metallopeptidase [Xanthomonadaceae bacterium]|jgi:beta-lactamase regulating signal transducer with metallopeptidase domain|nr:M56 family metallopeptidase [Xanthomonadaceae bacterium]
MKTELLAWLINATVATSIACAAVLLLRKPMRRWLGAEIAYRLWIVLPLAAFAAFLSLPRTTPVEGAELKVPVVSTPATVIVRVTTSLGSVNADRWLLAIWLLGVCALLVVLIWQQRRFVARLRLHKSGDGSWRSGIVDVAPAVLGLLRQRLVLPESFENEYSDEEQRLVLAHERMHQQRHDPWALATCALMRALFWFNPLVHAAAGRFRRDVELACDSAVLRAHPGSRRRYAAALFKSHIADGAIPVGCLWHQTPPMKERIMLLKRALPVRHARLAGAILLSMVALGTTGIAMAGHDVALDAASALAVTLPAQIAATPPLPPAQPAVADLGGSPAPSAQPTNAEVDTPPAAPAVAQISAPSVPPARAVHTRHVRLATASTSPAPALPAVSVAAIAPQPLAPPPMLAITRVALALAPIDTAVVTNNNGHYTIDMVYVDRVERAANEQGVKVIWLHPPEKRDSH